ncbi:alpha carbonic anhydrase 7 isoform X1 [Manihot esculenta]|uniref:alpha carbonic anhydrase 7 isoform X1 n=1 Tax=Manihot esculenta TaxID=3983 RepID=UPI001CC6697B|nr:alpha carbonic anhydrase 7 isoform X1 [Manihot esculenta]
MKQQKAYMSFTVTLTFVLLFSYLASSVESHEVEVEDEREFDYVQGSQKGPAHWGEIKKEWGICKTGKLQSPIDMANNRVKLIKEPGDFKRNYKACNSIIKNRGHDISVGIFAITFILILAGVFLCIFYNEFMGKTKGGVIWMQLQWEEDKAGTVEIDGSQYFLQQCHWHSPSEHTINSKGYKMEMHMVHLSTDPKVKNNIAVVGLLYEIGPPDAFLTKLLTDIKSLTDQMPEKSVGMINPTEIKMDGKEYYRYLGSLTVPPCTEGVIWIINKKISTVSEDQVKALRDAVHDYAEKNARPIQPLNEREIKLYGIVGPSAEL